MYSFEYYGCQMIQGRFSFAKSYNDNLFRQAVNCMLHYTKCFAVLKDSLMILQNSPLTLYLSDSRFDKV